MKKEVKKENSTKKSTAKEYTVFCGGKGFTVIGDDHEFNRTNESADTCQLYIFLKEEMVAYFVSASHFIINVLTDYQSEDLEKTRPRDFGKVDGCVF